MVRKDKKEKAAPREEAIPRSRATGQKQKTASSINPSPKTIPPPEPDKFTRQGIPPREDQGDFAVLRQRAEKQLQKEAAYPLTDFPAEAVRLIHELKVHQIELEMQNDELRQAQVRLEESRSKYVDLYDCAPVGYLTLTGAGQIVEVNLTAATLLGKERGNLLGTYFWMYLEEGNRRPFGWFLANYLILDEPQGEFSLQIGGKVRTMLLNLRFFRDRHGQRLHRLNLTDITELRQVRESLRQLTEQLLTFQEMERRRIARDLHDELGQSLMALKMKLNSVRRSFRLGEEPWEDFGRAIDYVNTIATKARNICQSLRPSVLEDLGLDQALHQLLEEFREQQKLELSEELEGLGGLFSAESQIAIYRIIQECLNNAIRHGEATRARVGAQRRDGAVCFICEDNGVGFDLAEVRARGEVSRGSGLIAVGERVRLLHGSLKITSAPGQGCRIVFTLPTDQKPA